MLSAVIERAITFVKSIGFSMNKTRKKYQQLAIIGFGPQARAIAANLTDSGREVAIVLRKNSLSLRVAKDAGYKVLQFGDQEIADYEVFYLLSSDNEHLNILENLKPHLNPDDVIIYAHGFSMVKFSLREKFKEQYHWLLAPKAIASEVRKEFLAKGALAGIYSLEGDDRPDAKERIRLLALDMGINVGPFSASFEQEMQADLFSEQTILCSLLPYASLKSYQILRQRGIPKELAYLECWHEVKLIAQALIDNGPSNFFKMISTNAFLGSNLANEIFFDSQFDVKMNTIANNIWNGEFIAKLDSLQNEENSKRSEVVNYWQKQELSETYNEIKSLLYKK